MRLLVRKLAPVAAAVLAMAGAATVAGTTSASAAPAGGWGCTGNEVSDSPYAVRTPSGAVFSYVHLYWNGSTGKNCAVNVKTGSLYGIATNTGLVITECVEDTPGGNCNPLGKDDPQNGNFRYYAGPVSVSGVGHCVVVQAWTDDNSGNEANLDVGPFHC
jgi:hypothetical protein